MKLGLISDLHLDFYENRIDEVLKPLKDAEPHMDALIVAGDTCELRNPQNAERFWKPICKMFKNKRIFTVPGNHEYFHISHEAARDIQCHLMRTFDNLVWLDNAYYFLSNGRTIHGGTMWYDLQWGPGSRNWSGFIDSWNIKDSANLVINSHRAFVNTLQDVRKGDVVVSHHAPHDKSVQPRFIGSELNAFFVADYKGYKPIKAALRKASYWFHGHMHDACDYRVGRCRVVANPLGYPSEGHFLVPKIIDIH